VRELENFLGRVMINMGPEERYIESNIFQKIAA